MHRFAKLGYVALNVTDLARSKHFYESIWGLELTETGAGGELYFRCGDDHHNVVLHAGPVPGLKRIGWEMESEADLDRVAGALEGHGLSVWEVDAQERASLHQGRSIRFSDPFTGATHEFYAVMHNLGGKPWVPTLAKIERLGHVVLKTPNQLEAIDFFTKVLNFKVSDAVDTYVTFMRAFPNPFRHSFALARGSGTHGSLHHVNFMVKEVDDIGKGIWRFRANDVPIVAGPGRHPPSGSMFLYVLDPDGITVEYSFGMEEFPEVAPRKPRLLAPVPASVDYWGSERDPRMGAIGEIETAPR